MADYFSVIQGAVGELEINTAAARRDVYDRARKALVDRLQSVEPKLPEPVVESELESLNEAIKRVETDHIASRGRFSRAASMAPGAGLGVIHTAPSPDTIPVSES